MIFSTLLVGTARSAVQEGQFRADLDPEQFAYEFWGAMLGHHHASRLMRDPHASERAARAFDALLRAARAGARPVRASRAVRATRPSLRSKP